MSKRSSVAIETPLLLLFQIGLGIHHINRSCESKFGLGIVQWCVLKHLIDLPGSSAQALADAVGIHPSTLTQTLKRLSKKGYIFIDEDPRDSRKKILSLTRDGKTALDAIELQLEAALNDVCTINPELEKIKYYLASHINPEPDNPDSGRVTRTIRSI